MKKLTLIFAVVFLLCFSLSHAQPTIQWQHCYGGTNNDDAKDIAPTNDGGYIMVGNTGSNDGDVTGIHGNIDIWVVKIDSIGSIQWQKCYGGSAGDFANAICQTSEGGYIIAGFSSSTDGDHLSIGHGLQDYWILKLDSSGSSLGLIQWENCFGGTEIEQATDIIQTSDGNYVVAGYTSSYNGDVTHNNNQYTGFWIVKIHALNYILWEKFIGESGWDRANSIQQTNDGGFIVAGSSGLTGNHGSLDYWIIKLDTVGEIQWQKCLGGSGGEVAYSIQQTSDQGYIVAGTTNSNDGDVTGNHGGTNAADYWVVKLDNVGNIQWQKCLGGSSNDYATSIQQTSYGNYIVAGYTSSNDGDVYGNNGGTDFWIVQIDCLGNIQWQKCIGGSSNDEAQSIHQTSDEGFVIAGFSSSNDSDVIGNHGVDDYWIVKLNSINVYNVIYGKVFLDVDNNCNFNSGDYALTNIYLKALPGPYYCVSDIDGNFSLYTDTGSYVVTQVTNGLPLFEQDCQLSYNVPFSHQYDTVTDINFANKADVLCPKLWVDIGTNNLIRCMNSQYFVQYCNNGTASVANAMIKIDFPAGITPQLSSLPWSAVNGSIYTFDIGNLGIGQCGSFAVTVSVSCDNYIGGTEKCVAAIILPDTVCVQPDTAWDRRQLRVIGSCELYGFARFVIRNEHVLNITQSGIYKIFVNNTLAVLDTFVLAQGDSAVYYYPANGNTIRFEINSTSLDYYQSSAEVTIEGCGNTTPVLGMGGQLPENDYADNYEKDCKIVRFSQDPNDKIVKPVGVTQMHYINQYDELEYQINFQNTGNDTAFNVILTDTISPFLDITSLVSGASSHVYTFNVSGANISKWTFNNILLPDSNVNLEGSKGFVKYKIQQQPNNLPNTVINNNAAIYFDYNDAVITNTTSNTVYDTTLLCTEPMPVSNFMFMQNGFDFAFNSTSVNADYFYWSFGDDSISFENNPWHTFQNNGQYNVCLVASNNCFCDTFCQTINVLITGIQNDLNQYLKINPNPATDNIIIESPQQTVIEISNIQGQIIKSITANENHTTINISDFAKGMYFVKVKTVNRFAVKKFIKQ
ncbi:MAG: T9SS type A sorting domain-containing protein [Bacteroidota bacterium]